MYNYNYTLSELFRRGCYRMTWVCDNCYSEMEVTHEAENRNRVYCPNCGTEWYVDDEDEYINE